MKKLLVVVDYQKDFVDGALGFPDAVKLEEGIYNYVQKTLSENGCVLFTRDTHDLNYMATREGEFLPIEHCIAGTPGHELYGRLHDFEQGFVPRVRIINKLTFGSSEIVRQAEKLCKGEPDEIEICGLVTDICVVCNAILLHSGFLDAKIKIIAPLCSSGNLEGANHAFSMLKGLGIDVTE